MRLTKRLATVTAAVAVTGLLAACTGAGAAADPAAPADSGGDGPVVVTVGTLSAQPHLFHVFFYEDFAPEGVEFEIVEFQTSPDIRAAVVSGTIDFGLAGIASAVAAVAAGQDLQIVAAAADGGTALVGSAGLSGIESLAGLTVGFPQGSTQEIMLRMSAAAAGMDPDADMDLVNLPFSDMASAFETGRIDAFASAEVGPSVAIDAGAVVVDTLYETPLGRVNIVMYTRATLVESDPELVQAVVDTHAAATEYMVANVDAWVSGLVDVFGIDQAVLEIAVQNIWPRWEIDAGWTAQVEAVVEQMLVFEQIDRTADIDALLTTAFTDAVSLGS